MSMNPGTQSELDSLRVGFSSIFETGFQSTPVFWKQLCTEVPSGGYSNVYGWAVNAFRLRQWIGPRMVQNIREHTFEVVNLPFEATVDLDLRAMAKDRNTIGVFKNTALAGLAAAAAKHPDDLFVQRLQANPTGFDGVAFFHSAHPNYNVTGTGDTTYDNLYDLALSKANFNTVWSAMTQFAGEDGRPLGVMPTHLIIPPQLKLTALELLQSTTYGQGTGATNAIDNVMKGWVDIIVIPELANNADCWYLADLSRPIKPWIFQKHSAPVLTALDSLTDRKVFEEKVATYGVDYEGNIAPTPPFLMAKSDPT